MNFIESYKNLVKNFKKENLFNEINGTDKNIEWPESSGVYVIWKNNTDEIKNLIYVGMTGKFTRNKNGNVVFNNAKFKSRTNRWTPYKFCESEQDNQWKFSFRYGPKSSSVNEQYKFRFQNDAYSKNIRYQDLIIHCFIINEDHQEYSPVLFESMLLTKYMKEIKNTLPPANNSL